MEPREGPWVAQHGLKGGQAVVYIHMMQVCRVDCDARSLVLLPLKMSPLHNHQFHEAMRTWWTPAIALPPPWLPHDPVVVTTTPKILVMDFISLLGGHVGRLVATLTSRGLPLHLPGPYVTIPWGLCWGCAVEEGGVEREEAEGGVEEEVVQWCTIALVSAQGQLMAAV